MSRTTRLILFLLGGEALARALAENPSGTGGTPQFSSHFDRFDNLGLIFEPDRLPENNNNLSPFREGILPELRAIEDEVSAFQDEASAIQDEASAIQDEGSRKAVQNKVSALQDKVNAIQDEGSRKAFEQERTTAYQRWVDKHHRYPTGPDEKKEAAWDYITNRAVLSIEGEDPSQNRLLQEVPILSQAIYGMQALEESNQEILVTELFNRAQVISIYYDQLHRHGTEKDLWREYVMLQEIASDRATMRAAMYDHLFSKTKQTLDNLSWFEQLRYRFFNLFNSKYWRWLYNWHTHHLRLLYESYDESSYMRPLIGFCLGGGPVFVVGGVSVYLIYTRCLAACIERVRHSISQYRHADELRVLAQQECLIEALNGFPADLPDWEDKAIESTMQYQLTIDADHVTLNLDDDIKEDDKEIAAVDRVQFIGSTHKYYNELRQTDLPLTRVEKTRHTLTLVFSSITLSEQDYRSIEHVHRSIGDELSNHTLIRQWDRQRDRYQKIKQNIPDHYENDFYNFFKEQGCQSLINLVTILEQLIKKIQHKNHEQKEYNGELSQRLHTLNDPNLGSKQFINTVVSCYSDVRALVMMMTGDRNNIAPVFEIIVDVLENLADYEDDERGVAKREVAARRVLQAAEVIVFGNERSSGLNLPDPKKSELNYHFTEYRKSLDRKRADCERFLATNEEFSSQVASRQQSLLDELFELNEALDTQLLTFDVRWQQVRNTFFLALPLFDELHEQLESFLKEFKGQQFARPSLKLARINKLEQVSRQQDLQDFSSTELLEEKRSTTVKRTHFTTSAARTVSRLTQNCHPPALVIGKNNTKAEVAAAYVVAMRDRRAVILDGDKFDGVREEFKSRHLLYCISRFFITCLKLQCFNQLQKSEQNILTMLRNLLLYKNYIACDAGRQAEFVAYAGILATQVLMNLTKRFDVYLRPEFSYLLPRYHQPTSSSLVEIVCQSPCYQLMTRMLVEHYDLFSDAAYFDWIKSEISILQAAFSLLATERDDAQRVILLNVIRLSILHCAERYKKSWSPKKGDQQTKSWRACLYNYKGTSSDETVRETVESFRTFLSHCCKFDFELKKYKPRNQIAHEVEELPEEVVLGLVENIQSFDIAKLPRGTQLFESQDPPEQLQVALAKHLYEEEDYQCCLDCCEKLLNRVTDSTITERLTEYRNLAKTALSDQRQTVTLAH